MNRQRAGWRPGVAGLFLAVLAALALVGCGAADYEAMQTEENGAAILRGETSYQFYGFVSGDALTDEQIGILDGDKDFKVYRVKDHPDSDWLLVKLDILMERGAARSLYRAAHVDSDPTDFVLDPESHFLVNYGGKVQ